MNDDLRRALGTAATTVVAADLDPEVLERATQTSTGIVVLPLRRVDGKAVYPELSVTLVKELRVAGADAAYLDPPDVRAFEVKKSEITVALASFVIGVASSAAWDAIKALFRKRPTSRLSVTYVELQQGSEQQGQAWRVDGETEGVLVAIDALRNGTWRIDEK